MTDGTAPVTTKQFEQLLQVALKPMREDINFLKENMATKNDIRALEIAMQEESRWVRDRLEWLRKGIDQALVVFGNADGERKSEIKNHERRLKRLEKKVGFAQAA